MRLVSIDGTPLDASSSGAPAPRRPRVQHQATVLGICNMKGGVGKTTTAVALASALAVRCRVLLIDLDSQCSASFALGITAEEAGPSVDDVLAGEATLAEAIQPSSVGGLDFATVRPSVSDMQQRLARFTSPQMRLREVLEPVRNAYEYIILDAPPSFSMMSRMAIFAADGIIAPVVPHALDFDALIRFTDRLAELRVVGWPVADLWGVVLTMVDTRTRIARLMIEQIRGWFPQTLRTQIPVNIRLAEAAQHGQSIFEYAVRARGARAYWRLSKEVVNLAQMQRLARRKKSPAAGPPMSRVA